MFKKLGRKVLAVLADLYEERLNSLECENRELRSSVALLTAQVRQLSDNPIVALSARVDEMQRTLNLLQSLFGSEPPKPWKDPNEEESPKTGEVWLDEGGHKYTICHSSNGRTYLKEGGSLPTKEIKERWTRIRSLKLVEPMKEV